MGVKKSNLLLWVATNLEILSRGHGTKKVKNRCRKRTKASTKLEYARAANKEEREFKTLDGYQQRIAEMVAKMREHKEVYKAAQEKAERLAKLVDDLTE